MALLIEATEIQEQGSVQGHLSATKEPVTERAKQAVQLAPRNREVLLLALELLVLYTDIPAFSDTKHLCIEYKARLDQLGGPGDRLLRTAGLSKEQYSRRYPDAKQTAGSGCVVGLLTPLALLVGVMALTAFGRV